MTTEYHLIRNRGRTGADPAVGGRGFVTCTCGETLYASTDAGAGIKWQEHRNRHKPLAERFADFHQAHPEVYEALVRLTRSASYAGANRIGIAMLFEVLRWEWILSRLPADNEAWKLNNDYKSRYARLIMQNEGWAAGIFELRRLSA